MAVPQPNSRREECQAVGGERPCGRRARRGQKGRFPQMKPAGHRVAERPMRSRSLRVQAPNGVGGCRGDSRVDASPAEPKRRPANGSLPPFVHASVQCPSVWVRRRGDELRVVVRTYVRCSICLLMPMRRRLSNYSPRGSLCRAAQTPQLPRSCLWTPAAWMLQFKLHCRRLPSRRPRRRIAFGGKVLSEAGPRAVSTNERSGHR